MTSATTVLETALTPIGTEPSLTKLRLLRALDHTSDAAALARELPELGELR